MHNVIVSIIFTFTFMHLAFIQTDLHCIQVIHFFVSMCVPWELNRQPFALLTQCTTTEPQYSICATVLPCLRSDQTKNETIKQLIKS